MNLRITRGAAREYFDEDTGVSLFSVSQVRKRMWDGFSRVPAEVLAESQLRGRRLHVRFALALGAQIGICPYPEVLPEYPGFCKSMDDWIEKHKVKPRKIEESSMNAKLGIGGTPDGEILYGPREILVLADWKTGQETCTDGVQLDANATLDGYTKAEKKLDLYLDKFGGLAREVWRTPQPADWAAFLQALQALKCDENLARWRNGR